MTRTFRGTVALLGLTLLQACASLTGIPVPDQGKYIDTAAARLPEPSPPVAEYIALRPVLVSTGVLEDNALAAYGRDVLERLLAKWPRTRPTISLYVVPDDAFQAEAVRDGAILLSIGTFRYLAQNEFVRSEDALAFILAHEAAHVLLGHARQRQGTNDLMHRAGGILSVGSTIAANTKFADAARTAKNVLIGTAIFMEASDGTLFPGWSRSQEFQADALAVDLMAKAGYSPQVVPGIMQVLRAAETQDLRAQTPPLVQAGSGGVSIQPGALLLKVMQDLRQIHPPVDDRDKDIRAYIEREWGDQLVAADTRRLRRVAANPEVIRVLADSTTAQRAMVDMQTGHTHAALDRIRTIPPSSPVGRSMIVLLVRAIGSLDTGDRSGLQQLEQAASHPRAVADLYRARALLAERQGAKGEAAAIWQADWERFEDRRALPQRIRLARSLGQNNLATMYQAHCMSLGESGVQEACAKAGS